MNFVYSSVTTEVFLNCRFLQKGIREVLLDPRGFSMLQMISGSFLAGPTMARPPA